MNWNYAMVTPACNEEKYIGRTIEGVLAQSLKPMKWIIISDGSTDKTDDIISSYAEKHSFIQLLRLEKKERTFFSKINAVNQGYKALKKTDFYFFANLDADIELPPDYYKIMLTKLNENPRLGIVSGSYIEEIEGKIKRFKQPLHHTPGSLQVFRRECYEAIGGYPLLNGGEDAGAGIEARMRGWETRAFREIEALHLKPVGSCTAKNAFKYYSHLGLVDYNLGSLAIFALAKSANRLFRSPYILGGLGLFAGFFGSLMTGKKRSMSREFLQFTKKEQWGRIKKAIGIKK